LQGNRVETSASLRGIIHLPTVHHRTSEDFVDYIELASSGIVSTTMVLLDILTLQWFREHTASTGGALLFSG
jgi:hypothetical protein